MESTRQQKISRLIQKSMSEIFRRQSDVFRGKMITVTKVYITRDLSEAKIFLSIFATQGKDEIMELVNLHQKDLRFRLGNEIRKQVRTVPELRFFIDDSLDYIDNIDRLLYPGEK